MQFPPTDAEVQRPRSMGKKREGLAAGGAGGASDSLGNLLHDRAVDLGVDSSVADRVADGAGITGTVANQADAIDTQ